MMMNRLLIAVLVLVSGSVRGADGLLGYYREPTLHGEVIVFQAEEDLWRVPVAGGVAQRLTTHLGREGAPVLSPDGKSIAFTASYEGPTEIYTMPVEGGRPTRRTHEGLGG
ncbi:MAG: hypothetical protein O3A92_15325, partial [Verrucomicrobia bacterium]|nr:hypothetical protein [Verrucomicrobiota bacterium]